MKKSRVSEKRSPKVKAGSKSTGSRKKQGDARIGTDPRTLLVPIDFSAGSIRALDFTEFLTRAFSAEIILVHVIDPFHAPGRFDAPRLRSLRADALEDAKAKLAELAASRATSAKPLEHHVVDGVVHTSIVKFAEKVNADWIVMGSKGQTGMKRLLAGSVAENVVRHARCPVMVIP